MKCFIDIKKQCFHLAISERDLTFLALHGLHSIIKEKLELYELLTINQSPQKVIVVETRLKDSCDIHRSHCPNMHAIEYHLDCSDNETNECCIAKFIQIIRLEVFHMSKSDKLGNYMACNRSRRIVTTQAVTTVF